MAAALKAVEDKLATLSEREKTIAAAAAAAAITYGAYRLLRGPPRVVDGGKYKGVPLPADVYDTVIVGGGPSGSTCGYFFAKARLPIASPWLAAARRAACGAAAAAAAA